MSNGDKANPVPNRVTSFQVFDRMASSNDPALQMAPLANIVRANYNHKKGTEIVIGWPGNATEMIEKGECVGGLLMVKRERFLAVKAEMEKELVAGVDATAETVSGPDKENSTVKIEDAQPIQVRFHTARIRPDGDIGSVVVEQGGVEIVLTEQQAKSLAKQVTERLGA